MPAELKRTACNFSGVGCVCAFRMTFMPPWAFGVAAIHGYSIQLALKTHELRKNSCSDAGGVVNKAEPQVARK
jgi:hypothetical protein